MQVTPSCCLCDATAGKPWRDMSKEERKSFKPEGKTFTCRECRTRRIDPSGSMVSV